MLATYNPNTLVVTGLIFTYPPDYAAKVADVIAVPADEVPDVRLPSDVYVERVDGVLVCRVAASMQILHPLTVKVNDEEVVEGVPEGAEMFLNDEPIGTMDASGRLEFTPETAGAYRLRFVARGYKPTEVTFEAVP
jgi:hypothetical protein